jgi:TRAP-type C4-dicarboxylate transport system substrate-binding protein
MRRAVRSDLDPATGEPAGAAPRAARARPSPSEEEPAMKRGLSVAAVAACALLFAGAAGAQTRLKAGHILPNTSDQGQASEFFAQRVKALSNGAIEVQVFHAGELGKSMPAQLENVVSGAQDFLIDTFDYFKAWDERFGIVNTPFVFRDREHFKKFLRSPLFADMVGALEKRGVVFLGKPDYNWLRASDRGVLSKKPIFVPDDLKGMKMRMFQAEAPIKAWAALGANIQVIPWPDTYTALVTGTVEGLTGVVSASYLTKQTEVVRYFTNVQEYFQIVAPIVSERTWKRLSPEQQAMLNKAAVEAGEKYLEISRAERDTMEYRARLEHGLSIIEPPVKPWQEAARALHVRFEAEGILPKGLIAQVQAIQ